MSLSHTATKGLVLATAVLAIFVGAAVPARADGLADPGPYLAGWQTVTVTRPDSSTFTALLYYPALSAGQNAPYNNAGAPYPAISFGHGFLTNPSYYQSTFVHLAAWGYFVIATQSGGELFPDHAKYAADLSQCFTYLETQNANSRSWLYGQLAVGHYGLSGHSMGGGASILAAAQDTRVRAVANLAAAETNPSAIAAIAGLRIPVVLVAGDHDNIAPPVQHQIPMYDAVPAPRQLPLILGGSHCGFLDVSIPFCDNGSLPRVQQLEITRRLLTACFNLYLQGDQSVWPQVWGPEALTDSRVDLTRCDPGIGLSPVDISAPGTAGHGVTIAFQLTNTGPVADSFTLFVERNQWPMAPNPPQTTTVEPGASVAVAVDIQIPGGAGNTTDSAIVSARADRDGGTRGYATLHVHAYCPGDLNCDGVVNFDDINPFVLALSDPAGYAAQYPNCSILNGDCNNDGVVNFDDINPFVEILSGN